MLFTKKAEQEILIDNLTEDLVCEAIINAPSITKTLRFKNPFIQAIVKLYTL